ncbi:MAG: hypothetical protein CME91_09805 [Hyphomonadaceae bacterium]|nr:hypothetical protein [Hyphomonadaceae bacterium]MBA27619.1 hypothetical protein [Hyphomonadaceae bacterium]
MVSRFNFAFAAAALVLGACATSTPYAPMDGRYGYAEQRIETNRYRVAFHGNSSTSRETVEAFLLYRAAELTLENGFDYFLVVERDTDVTRTYTSTGPDRSVYGYYRQGYHRFPYYAYGYPWSYDATVREHRRFEANAYIQMHKGEKPKGDIRAFDARDVIKNLRPGVQKSLTPGS